MLGTGCRAQHPLARLALWRDRRRVSRLLAARPVKQQLYHVTGLERGLPGLRCRPRAAFPMQHDRRDKRDIWMNARLDRQTDGLCRR